MSMKSSLKIHILSNVRSPLQIILTIPELRESILTQQSTAVHKSYVAMATII